MAYLYNTIVQEFGKRELARIEIPNTIQKYQLNRIKDLNETVRRIRKTAQKRTQLCERQWRTEKVGGNKQSSKL